jgi:hypothetical protein
VTQIKREREREREEFEKMIEKKRATVKKDNEQGNTTATTLVIADVSPLSCHISK